MTTLSEALRWHEKGITPIPCFWGTKRPKITWSNWVDEKPSHLDVVKWFRKKSNLSLLSGSGGLFVLDFDAIPTYYRWKLDYPDLANSYTVQTARGMHVYLRCESTISTIAAIDNVDILGYKHLVCAPPSLHPSGERYKVLQDGEIITVQGLEQVIDIPEPTYETEIKRYSSPRTRIIRGNGIISDIKRRLPLIELLYWYTTPLPSSRNGRYYIMRCPNPSHSDRVPSFWLDARLDICGCFKPSCQATQPSGLPMDIFNLVQWLDGITNEQAIEKLRQEVRL
jgi:hypothetical protein